MKKLKLLLVSIITIFAFNITVFAASGSLSTSTGSVYVGDSFTVSVNVNSVAAWNIHVSASGPVSGCSINQADATADAMDTNKTFSATCTATGTGTITINLSGDVSSAVDGVAVNVSGSKTVTVSEKPAPPPSNNNNNNNGGNNNPPPSNNNNNNNTNNNVDNRSKNNNIKELSVDGYQLVKVDANNYTLSVPTDVTSINIKATAEDAKSKVSGSGTHDIKVGENNIEVIVTAENGAQNKINIKVTRKDGYYLEDLDKVLDSKKTDDINITIKTDTEITSKDLEKIKNSKKLVTFNCYDENKKLKYSWIIDGSKLQDTNSLSTSIINDSDNKKDILRLSNYADGLITTLKQSSNLPAGSKIKMFVGNKYEDDSLVNVYSYAKNGDKLELVKNKIKVEDGFIEFDVIDSSEYFVTMSNIPSAVKIDNNQKETSKTNEEKSSPIILYIIIGILSLLVIGLLLALILKNKKSKNEDNSNIETDTIENKPVVDNASVLVDDKTPTKEEKIITNTKDDDPIVENDKGIIFDDDVISIEEESTEKTIPVNDTIPFNNDNKINDDLERLDFD